MYEITYSSLVKKDVTATDIADILARARIFNAKHNLTGCLLFYNNEFLQVLEGDEQVIRELFKKIEKDKRHFNIRVLAEAEKEERTFRNWTMAYRELSSSAIRDLGESLFENNFLTFSEMAEKPTKVIRLFWERAQRLIAERVI